MELNEIPPYHFKFDLSSNNDVTTSLLFLKESDFVKKEKFVFLRQFEKNEFNHEIHHRFMRETNIIISLNSPFNQKLLFYSIKNSFLILESLPNGNLEDYLEDNKELSEIELFKIIYQICLSIQILHKNNIIHRDIQPSNFYFGENNQIALGDFGLSRFESPLKSCNSGTVGYVAPEIINNDEYSFPADIYSLGCTIFYLLFGKRPYHFEESDNITLSLAKKKNLIDYYESILLDGEFLFQFKEIQQNKPFYFELVKKCIEIDPNNRPNINSIIEELNEFGLKQYDFENLFKILENSNSQQQFENGTTDQIFSINSSFTSLCKSLYSFEILKNKENGEEDFKSLNKNSTYFSKLKDYLLEKGHISSEEIEKFKISKSKSTDSLSDYFD